MQVSNPLVPPSFGQAGGAPAPVANAPNAQDATKRETSHPVTASRESERDRNETGRRPQDPGPDYRPGDSVDIRV